MAGRLATLAGAALLLGAAPARAVEFEPRLTIASPDPAVREVALTFDACSGAVDRRILDALLETRAKATIFVTQRWIRRNPEALATLKAHPDQFEIENHGARHVPIVTDARSVFGLAAAGTIQAVRAEIGEGAAAVETATGGRPRWFRGATARYSRDALDEISAEGFRVAGFSLNGDMGASLPAAVAERRIAAARSGDVVIAHINQPARNSGEGVAAAIRALAAAGVRFVRLEDAAMKSEDGRPILPPKREIDHELRVERHDDQGDKPGGGGHPAGSHELSHLGAAGGEPDQRNDREGQLQTQHDLAQHK